MAIAAIVGILMVFLSRLAPGSLSVPAPELCSGAPHSSCRRGEEVRRKAVGGRRRREAGRQKDVIRTPPMEREASGEQMRLDVGQCGQNLLPRLAPHLLTPLDQKRASAGPKPEMRKDVTEITNPWVQMPYTKVRDWQTGSTNGPRARQRAYSTQDKPEQWARGRHERDIDQSDSVPAWWPFVDCGASGADCCLAPDVFRTHPSRGGAPQLTHLQCRYSIRAVSPSNPIGVYMPPWN